MTARHTNVFSETEIVAMKQIISTLRASLRNVLSLASQEMRRINGDRNVLLVLVVAPLLYSLIFGLTYLNGKVYDLPIAVVDMDRSELSRTVIRSLEANESLHVSVVLDNESSLRDLLAREECWAAVVLPPDMERTIKRGNQAQVQMMVNTSNIIIGNYAQKGIQTVLGSVGAAISMDKMEKKGTPAYAVYTAYSPVELQTRVLFNPATNYALFVVPLLIVLLIHQVVALGAGMSWAKSMSDGTVIARDALHSTILGRSLPYAGAAIFWLGISILGTHTLLGIPFTGSVPMTVLFAILLATTVTLVGTLAGVLVRDKLGVVQMLFFTSMPLLLLSGGSWPTDSMPAGVRAFAGLLPSTYLMNAYRSLSLEDPSFASLLPALGMLSVLAAVLYIILVMLLRQRGKA